MGQAIGGSLPLAAGIALSPIPIIAVILMLTSGRAIACAVFAVIGTLGVGIPVGLYFALGERSRNCSPG
jgi:hypothetical protein